MYDCEKYIEDSVVEDQEIPIFTKQFGVDALNDPKRFLPHYRENAN